MSDLQTLKQELAAQQALLSECTEDWEREMLQEEIDEINKKIENLTATERRSAADLRTRARESFEVDDVDVDEFENSIARMQARNELNIKQAQALIGTDVLAETTAEFAQLSIEDMQPRGADEFDVLGDKIVEILRQFENDDLQYMRLIKNILRGIMTDLPAIDCREFSQLCARVAKAKQDAKAKEAQSKKTKAPRISNKFAEKEDLFGFSANGGTSITSAAAYDDEDFM